MKVPAIPENETERLASLKGHQLLDTMPEDVYDDITRIASEICGTPISLLTLVDEKRQWFKSKQGLTAEETPREVSFCAHAIVDPQGTFVVPDARYDERFHDNPLTTGEPHVVFYAGVPVKDTNGNALGTLCVIDSRPRDISSQQLDSLKALAGLINAHFELRRSRIKMEAYKRKIALLGEATATISVTVAALSKSGVQSLDGYTNTLKEVEGVLRRNT